METFSFSHADLSPTMDRTVTHISHSLEDARWKALIARSSASDGGDFLYGVTSTGVVCRPTCASRRPVRQNVQFFDSLPDAMAAGYRPCLRCRPDGIAPEMELAQGIDRVRRYLDRHVESGDTSLANLGKIAGMSPGYLQRKFRAALGLSPAEYLRRLRSQMLEYALETATVTDAIYAAGYRSASRVYAKRAEGLGMTPGTLKRKGIDQAIRYSFAESPLGRMMVASTAQGVCCIAFADTDDALRQELAERFSGAERTEDTASLAQAVEQVVASISEPSAAMKMPLHVRATAFQQRVWKALQQIPAGETRTYSEVAVSIGQPTAARAVARACATNPIAVVVPCHRVVGADGSLTGYRWGTQRKRTLLQLERERHSSPGE